MARCKDCIHSGLCEDMHRFGVVDLPYNGDGATCDHYKPADVAPRAEVARLQSQVNRLKKYDEQRDIALHARLISETRHKVALEIFGEIDEIINEIYNKHIFGVNDLDDIEKDAVINYSDDITDKIAELKKKYTEEMT